MRDVILSDEHVLRAGNCLFQHRSGAAGQLSAFDPKVVANFEQFLIECRLRPVDCGK